MVWQRLRARHVDRPVDFPELLASYERQLCTYAHILEKRHGKRSDRLLFYWTSEPRKKDALMEFPYRPELVQEARRHFDTVVGKIKAKDFRVLQPPEPGICKECDLCAYCVRDGLNREADGPGRRAGGDRTR